MLEELLLDGMVDCVLDHMADIRSHIVVHAEGLPLAVQVARHNCCAQDSVHLQSCEEEKDYCSHHHMIRLHSSCREVPLRCSLCQLSISVSKISNRAGKCYADSFFLTFVKKALKVDGTRKWDLRESYVFARVRLLFSPSSSCTYQYQLQQLQ